jgi:hypothetical protein
MLGSMRRIWLLGTCALLLGCAPAQVTKTSAPTKPKPPLDADAQPAEQPAAIGFPAASGGAGPCAPRPAALGIDATGRVLLYGMGEELEPPELAEGMRVAGAKDAAQLDINWSWTRFLVFGEPEGKALQTTSTLIPKMVHTKRGYVETAADRDFFYVIRRSEPWGLTVGSATPSGPSATPARR